MTALLGVDDGPAGAGAGDWYIAVRAGGHNLGRSNNVDNGVTIDLQYLNATTYDKATNVASIGPGGRWQNVYAELHQQHGVLVTGGRDGDVGVGGFLLGGGSSYFMGRHGFGCDAIRNFQVVLTNGSIVNANNSTNADLWRALKGGGSNFGIVTRYDLEALPDKPIAYATRVIAPNNTAAYVNAVVNFTDNQQKFDGDALVGFLLHADGQDFIETIEVNVDGNENSPAFDNLRKIPTVAPPYQTIQPLSVAAANSTLKGDAWCVELLESSMKSDFKSSG